MFIEIILFVVLAVCVYTDITARKIYNLVLLPACVSALLYYLLTGGLGLGWWSVQGLLLGIALLIIPFATGGIGAGDVKLLGIIGALKGPNFVLIAFLAGAIVGGVISAIYLIRQKKMLSVLKNIGYNIYYLAIGAPRIRVIDDNGQTAVTIPYGAAIALGAAAAYFVR